MYIENKSGGTPGHSRLLGPARIGRVEFSKSGKTIHYKEKTFRSLKGAGFKANFREIDSWDEYWISGPKKNGEDGLHGSRPTPIDDDVREEYWTFIRKQPENKNKKTT